MGLIGGESAPRFHWGSECGWGCSEHQALKLEQSREESRNSSGGGSLYNSSGGIFNFKLVLFCLVVGLIVFSVYQASPNFRKKWDTAWDSKGEVPESVRKAESYEDPIFK